MPAEARVGTIGFAYREWSGHVYPPEATPRQFLPLYAQRLSGVEISTLPPDLAESWAASVPPSFQFAVKAPGRVASELASGKGAVRAMAAFMRVAFDFRHPSWRDDATLRLLSKHDAALVLNDEGEGAPRIELTAGFTYVRIRRDDDTPDALDEWAERLGGLARRGIDVYAFLKNDRKGVAVDRAMRLSSLLRAESGVGETAMLS